MSQFNVLLLIGPGLTPTELSQVVTAAGTGRLVVFHHHVDLPKQLSRENSSTFHKIVSHSLSPNFHSAELFSQLLRLLAPGGLLEIREVVVPDANSGPLRTVDDVQLALNLGGFVEVSNSVSAVDPALVLPLFGQAPPSLGAATVSGKKPEWEIGAVASLKRGKPVPTSESAPKKSVWTINALDDDVELANEDDLLEAADLQLPSKKADDCEFDGAGKAKPCKDCTCGRAEQEFESGGASVAVRAPVEAPKTVKSACGSCYLGDAFRCPTCPSLGLPAYKPGETVKLSLD